MRLSDYLDEQKLSDDDFAKLVNRDRSSIYRLRRGMQKPSADLLRLILEKTDGAVTPNDFFDVPETDVA